MRIIAGKYKGRTLLSPDSERVKPTLDRVKEAIFDKLQFDLIGADVLDLFTGSGALGLEACSRGASKVVMVDSDTSLAKKNVDKLGAEVELMQKDALKALEDFKQNNEQFDIILLDPPFKSDLGLKAIEKIDKDNLLAENGILVWEKSYGINIPLKLINLCVGKIKKYGTIQVIYLKHIKNI